MDVLLSIHYKWLLDRADWHKKQAHYWRERAKSYIGTRNAWARGMARKYAAAYKRDALNYEKQAADCKREHGL